MAAVLLALAGCKGGEQTSDLACTADSDCTIPGTRCDDATGLCVCTTDEACEEGFFCNNAGVCQARSGCVVNADCAEGTFCDAATGKCLNGPPMGVGGACGLASHCPYGTICVTGSCAAGCYDDGDCPLGQICFEGQCATGDDVCSNDDFCEYGELCKDLSCTEDRRGPYCRGCTQRTAQNPVPCDHPRNFCLVNSLEAGGHQTICGVDCSLGQACPNGYGCTGVVILTQDVCYNHAECQCSGQPYFAGVCRLEQPCEPEMGSETCRVPDHPDCGEGTLCLVATGTTTGSCTCAGDDQCDGEDTCVSQLCCPSGSTVREDRECAVGENRVSGYCTCATDDDCPRDTCDATQGACAITGLPCTPGANDCGPIPCVNGGCLIGENCAPEQGLSCSVVGGR